MKLLLGCAAYPPDIIGGGEISTQNLAEALVRDGVDVTVVTVAASVQRNNVNGVDIVRLAPLNVYWSGSPARRPLLKKALWHLVEGYNVSVARRLRQVLDEVKPDIFHTSTIEDLSPYSWKVATERGIPVVHTLRSYTLMCPRGTMFKRDRNCVGQCAMCREVSRPKRILSRYVNEVVGNSRAILEQHLKVGFFPSAGTHVVFNICDPDRSISTSAGRRGPIRFGYLGRLHLTKGLELLIEQFETVCSEFQSELLIAGKGDADYERSLRGLVKTDAVKFVGHRNAGEFLNDVDILIVPSLWHEPLPRAILEACSYGVPVIASSRGGNPEIVISGRTGFLFDPDEKESLGEAMMRFKRDPDLLSRLREGCIAYASTFSSTAISARYRRVYEKALERENELGDLVRVRRM